MVEFKILEPEFVAKQIRLYNEHAATTTSSYELAVLERELWRRVRRFIDGPPQKLKQSWWDATFGQRAAASFRAALLMRGERVKVLWQYIDNDQITLRAAISLVRRMERDETLSLTTLISEHLALPVTESKRGLYRRRPRKDSLKPDESTVRPAPVQVVEAKTPPEAEAEPAAPTASKFVENSEEWRAIRETLGTTIDTLVSGFGEPQRGRLRREFKLEVDLLLRSINSRLRKERNSPGEKSRYRDIVEACTVLHVKPPKRGCAIDQKIRAEAQRNFRRLARHYHPDMRGGDESYRHLLDCVTRAWDVINNMAMTTPTNADDQKEG